MRKMVDLGSVISDFPSEYRRTVHAWYEWQGYYLWSRGRAPGDEDRAPAKWESIGEVFWGADPPQLQDGIFTFGSAAGDLKYFVVTEAEAFFIDVEERGSRERYWMFRQFDDLEKYLLFIISQDALTDAYAGSLRARWRRQGVDPRVTLSQPDPENFPGRMSITVRGESAPRCWMGRGDAITFSHGIVVSYEELDRLVREGLSNEGFQRTGGVS
ncbi:hypothetical protein O6072_21030 [Mycolicibacterium neoaurum]|uniref:hypothetical protein n=1 Tax=Mycolicibacterium neoaurum TaxID=1795 RepID=UPI00248AFCFA|nr:hypothetical protein [Mycolicibacterium neoaurum]WBP93522.1 hypothetical protein O7W24_20530 [Mycolicibacterium neoaurum]WBS07315.1 hypothetical protein O6072_21030 [Mycolicibacterium neoaurum]